MVFTFYAVLIEVKRKVENKYILSLINNEPEMYRKHRKRWRVLKREEYGQYKQMWKHSLIYDVWVHSCCLAQTQTRMGCLRKSPEVEFDSYRWLSHLGVRTPYAARRKRRYEVNQVKNTEKYTQIFAATESSKTHCKNKLTYRKIIKILALA